MSYSLANVEGRAALVGRRSLVRPRVGVRR